MGAKASGLAPQGYYLVSQLAVVERPTVRVAALHLAKTVSTSATEGEAGRGQREWKSQGHWKATPTATISRFSHMSYTRVVLDVEECRVRPVDARQGTPTATTRRD